MSSVDQSVESLVESYNLNQNSITKKKKKNLIMTKFQSGDIWNF